MREKAEEEEEEDTRLESEPQRVATEVARREIQIVINSKLRKEIDEAKIVRFIR